MVIRLPKKMTSAQQDKVIRLLVKNQNALIRKAGLAGALSAADAKDQENLGKDQKVT